MTSCEVHDISAVDIHYHSSCYIKFALKSLSATAAEEYNMLQLNLFKRVCLLIQKRIICGKEAFLISDLFENIKHLCEENGIEKSIITTLKKKIIDIFPEEVSFYPNGKYLTTH